MHKQLELQKFEVYFIQVQRSSLTYIKFGADLLQKQNFSFTIFNHDMENYYIDRL